MTLTSTSSEGKPFHYEYKQKLLRKDIKLWRAMIAHILKEYSAKKKNYFLNKRNNCQLRIKTGSLWARTNDSSLNEKSRMSNYQINTNVESVDINIDCYVVLID